MKKVIKKILKYSGATFLVLLLLFCYRYFYYLGEFSDLRGMPLFTKSIKNRDLSDKYEILLKSTFDTFTVWPPKEKMPSNFKPNEILSIGQNPGLGIKALHAKGITGNGIRVAIIDQPLLLNHEEYKNKILKYTPIDCNNIPPQMHGASVASILVGDKCGVAPGASLYYWAEPSWKKDYYQRSTALEQIIQFNKNKPLSERIRVVSVSVGFVEDYKNLDLWKKTLEKAKQEGIIVIHCSSNISGVRCPLYQDRDNPANYEICYFIQGRESRITPGRIYVPIDNRTTASFQGEDDYVFWSRGGLSWGAPYLAGVAALGLQVNPDLNPNEVLKYLKETGTPFKKGCIVNPPKYIEQVKKI